MDTGNEKYPEVYFCIDQNNAESKVMPTIQRTQPFST